MSNTSTINMKAGDKPRGANELSTFNGVVLTIGRPEVIAKLINIQVSKSQTNASSFTTSNIPSIFNDPSQYSFNGTSISLNSFHQRIIITYEKPEVTQAEFEAAASPEMVAFQQKMIADIGNPMKASAKTLNIQEITGNASPFNSMGAVFGGFKGLQAGSKPTANFVKRVRVAQLQSGAADGSADKSSSQTTNLTTLFKKTGLSSTGNLNKVVFTQGSVNSIIDELKTHTTAPSETIQSEARAVLPASLSTKIIDQAVTAIEDKDAGVTVESKMTKEVETEVKSKIKEAQNAGLDLDPSAFGCVPGIARSGTNTFANLLGKVKGVKAKFPPSIKNLMSGLPEGVTPPLDAFGGAGPEIPNLIEGTDAVTGKLNLSTNTSKLLSKGKLIPNISPSNIVNISSNSSAWKGYFTPSTYKFEFVDTSDELKTELEKSSRFKEKVVAIIIGWSDKVWGPPEKVNATSIHEISKESDLKNLIEREGNAQSAIKKIREKEKLFGIQAHYLILTDGRIQRGRPINEFRNPETSSFDKTGMQVTIIANRQNPVNPDQLTSLDKLMSQAYKSLSGINVFADYEIEPSKAGPAVDIASLRDKYGKTNTIDNPKDAGNGPDRKQIVYTKPSDIAQGAKTKSTEPFSFNKIASVYENTDPLTGEALPVNAEADIASVKTALNDLSTGKLDISKGISQAVNDPKNSLAKTQGDSIVKKLIPGVDKNKSFVDTISKKLDTKSLTSLFGGK